jgi:hypothetical protein
MIMQASSRGATVPQLWFLGEDDWEGGCVWGRRDAVELNWGKFDGR